jgi:hypothetical protein
MSAKIRILLAVIRAVAYIAGALIVTVIAALCYNAVLAIIAHPIAAACVFAAAVIVQIIVDIAASRKKKAAQEASEPSAG